MKGTSRHHIAWKPKLHLKTTFASTNTLRNTLEDGNIKGRCHHVARCLCLPLFQALQVPRPPPQSVSNLAILRSQLLAYEIYEIPQVIVWVCMLSECAACVRLWYRPRMWYQGIDLDWIVKRMRIILCIENRCWLYYTYTQIIQIRHKHILLHTHTTNTTYFAFLAPGIGTAPLHITQFSATCVRVCVCERERERECVCILCVYACVFCCVGVSESWNTRVRIE